MKIGTWDLPVNNHYYDQLGDRWYQDDQDPVALLRAELRLKNPWVAGKIQEHLGPGAHKALDLGCGGGFLSNFLASQGHSVTGVDLSGPSLTVAKKHDSTGKVQYLRADAQNVPLPDGSQDVVCAMDFLEHVENPLGVVGEAARLLRPGGIFFYHTFNRGFLAWLVVIKCMEWFMPNTPERLHILRLFIRPKELEGMMQAQGLTPLFACGLRPKFFSLPFWASFFARRVRPDLEFTFSSSLKLGYIGYARKQA